MASFAAVASMAGLMIAGGLFGKEGNGRIQEQVREVGAFTGIDVGGGVVVDARVGSPQKVTVTVDENLQGDVETFVRDGVLYLEHSGLRPTQNIRLTVVVPKLESLEASGGVKMRVVAGPTQRFRIDGSGGVEMDVSGLEADELDVDLSGGTEVRIAGKVKKAHYELSGGVQFEAGALQARTAEIDASGGVEATLHVTESLEGEASGGVDVKVKGRPAVKVETSGGGSVQSL